MKKSEIKVGGFYWAKVTGVLTTVRVDRIEQVHYKGTHGHTVTRYACVNMATDKKVFMRSAMRFYRESVNTLPKKRVENLQNIVDSVRAFAGLPNIESGKAIWCPTCGNGPASLRVRLIESTEPDESGEFKDVCTCDHCNNIFYIVRNCGVLTDEEYNKIISEQSGLADT